MAERGQVPAGYSEVLYWKVTDSARRIWGINLLGLPFLFGCGAVFYAWGAFVGQMPGVELNSVASLIGLIVGSVLTLALHELAHGVAMSAFGARPQYGILPKAFALYATAPGYAFTRNQYLVVMLTPLMALSGLALVGMWLLAGTPWVGLLVACAAINASGVGGDVWMATLVARYPPQAYATDERDGMRIFLPLKPE